MIKTDPIITFEQWTSLIPTLIDHGFTGDYLFNAFMVECQNAIDAKDQQDEAEFKSKAIAGGNWDCH